jgi:hypothetical protein
VLKVGLHPASNDGPRHNAVRRCFADLSQRFQRCYLLRNCAFAAKSGEPPTIILQHWDRCRETAATGLPHQRRPMRQSRRRDCRKQCCIIEFGWRHWWRARRWLGLGSPRASKPVELLLRHHRHPAALARQPRHVPPRRS